MVTHTRDAELGNACPRSLSRLTELAKEDCERKFTSIAHFLTLESLYAAFRSLRKDASAVVDQITYADYATQARENNKRLWERLNDRMYRAQPLHRIHLPKEDGSERPISIPALEDKIVQKATVRLLNAIYETNFLACSNRFRPGRGPHDALDEVDRIHFRQPIFYVLELDITSYFDTIVRALLMEMIEKQIGDGSILRLIRKWINVGVIDEGHLLVSETGTGQGQVISPLLANIYLHHVLDVWFENEVKPRLTDNAFEVRYADDALLWFQYQEDAQKVLKVLSKRFLKYGLTLHPERTRPIEFGRSALLKAEQAKGQSATFDFLGLTHFTARGRRGKFTVKSKTMKRRLKRGLTAVATWCKAHRHDPVVEQQAILNAKLRGHYQYYGRSSNYRCLWQFYRGVQRSWRKWLSRCSRGTPVTWDKYALLFRRHPLVRPQIVHTWADSRSRT